MPTFHGRSRTADPARNVASPCLTACLAAFPAFKEGKLERRFLSFRDFDWPLLAWCCALHHLRL